MSLLDLLIKKTVEIAIDKGVLVSKTLIVDATHTNARYNQKSAREVLLERAKSLRKEVSSANMNQVIFLLPVIIIETIIISMFSRDLNIILTGDDTAKSLGIEVETVRKTLLITCSIITAACVSVICIISFIFLTI
ncbi:Fe3+-siderophore ABC transporter permease [Clostridium pasteurianum DSM 525 = ATCC 6013]|nr:Fe3+-siderophore ABC transporter permease [Clostridium pasteurianum DSM 525 = ATCC 6013]